LCKFLSAGKGDKIRVRKGLEIWDKRAFFKEKSAKKGKNQTDFTKKKRK